MRLLEVPITWLRDALASWSGPGQPHAPARPASLTPAHHQVPDGLVQPDQTTCGSACLVVARALGDPDVFLDGDVGVRHGLARCGADAGRSESWRPWRSYALRHLRAAGEPDPR